VNELGGVDVMCNIAGVPCDAPLATVSEEELDRMVGINMKGVLFGCQAALPAMKARSYGRIINISSSAIRGDARGVHYSASKAGVLGLTRAMALELAPYGIRVNAIAPGLTDTAQPRYGNTEEELTVMASAVPLGRMAQPDDIASVAVFLASDDARYVTGQTVHVNGGSFMP